MVAAVATCSGVVIWTSANSLLPPVVVVDGSGNLREGWLLVVCVVFMGIDLFTVLERDGGGVEGAMYSELCC